MNLFEYQTKSILKKAGINIPAAILIDNQKDIKQVIDSLRSNHLVVKAQILAGSRKTAGGVIVDIDQSATKDLVCKMLGSTIVTSQTDENGSPVKSVLVEKYIEPKNEFYIAITIDKIMQRVVLIASRHNVEDIEKVASQTPELIYKVPLSISRRSVHRSIIKRLAKIFEIDRNILEPFIDKLYQVFIENDMTLLEINPLAIDSNNKIFCLDAKAQIDDSAAYRHPEHKDFFFSNHETNYVELEGNIGCIANGAGLAMATNDLLVKNGLKPANFLDLSGGISADGAAVAISQVLSHKKVDIILVNIFGGIVSCDIIANSIIASKKSSSSRTPIIVRFNGTMSEEGKSILRNQSDIILENDLTQIIRIIKKAIK